MRIVIDLQGAQTPGRQRGIGRHCLALAQAMARNAGSHELWLALNGRLPAAIEGVRAAFDGLIPQERIRVFDLPGPLAESDPANLWRRRAAEALRATFLADLQPDIVHVSSLFENYRTDAVCTFGNPGDGYRTCVTLYDPIPLRRQETGLADPGERAWCLRQLESLKRADLLLAISELRRREAIEALALPPQRVVNICAAVDQSCRAPPAAEIAPPTVGAAQAEKFSPDASARRALAAFEALHGRARNAALSSGATADTRRRPRLAFVSPLPPAASGIADYSADLLPALSRHYEIELVVGQQAFPSAAATAGLPIRTVEWFEANAGRFDRVLYQMGNSPFHAHMPALLARCPGVVVLHDFFLSALVCWQCGQDHPPTSLPAALYASHGYAGLRTLGAAGAAEITAMALKYPINLDVLRRAAGLIVHSRMAIALARRWYGMPASDFRLVPMPRSMPAHDRAAARRALGLDAEAMLVCCFGILGASKLNDRLLQAWRRSRLGVDRRCHLVFVGSGAGQYCRDLLQAIAAGGYAGRVRHTGLVDAAGYARYLAAADLAVQLRTDSRGETSRAVLDCLACGLAVIVNAHGTMDELPNHVVHKLPDQFGDAELAHALEARLDHAAGRQALGAAAAAWVREYLAPDRISASYRDAIEHFACASAMSRRGRLLRTLAGIQAPIEPERADLLATAACIHANRPPASQRQLLIDVSSIAVADHRTGTCREMRAYLRCVLADPPAGIRVEPVYGRSGQYRYARNYTLSLLGRAGTDLADEPIDPAAGDIFLGLELDGLGPLAPEQAIRAWRRQGVLVYFVVPDLLPILREDSFTPQVPPAQRRWLELRCELADGLVCVSRTMADELFAWLTARPPRRERSLDLAWFDPGADLDASAPTQLLAPMLRNGQWYKRWRPASPDSGPRGTPAHCQPECAAPAQRQRPEREPP